MDDGVGRGGRGGGHVRCRSVQLAAGHRCHQIHLNRVCLSKPFHLSASVKCQVCILKVSLTVNKRKTVFLINCWENTVFPSGWKNDSSFFPSILR